MTYGLEAKSFRKREAIVVLQNLILYLSASCKRERSSTKFDWEIKRQTSVGWRHQAKSLNEVCMSLCSVNVLAGRSSRALMLPRSSRFNLVKLQRMSNVVEVEGRCVS